VNKKLLGLQIDNRLNWTNHFDKQISMLSAACYVVRSTFHITNTELSNQFISPVFTL
jgi:hypothetical protein